MPSEKSIKFDLMLLEAIDEAFSSLGESVKKSVYFHLENTYLVKRPQIPHEINGFSNALDKMFGLGARYLEILIMRRFYPKIKVSCDWQGPEFIIPSLSFKEYIDLVRSQYCKVKIKGQIEFLIDAVDQEYVSETKERVANKF
jgi:hypothetical protein